MPGNSAVLVRTVVYPPGALITSQPSIINLSQPGYLSPVSLPGLSTKIVRITEQNAGTFGTGLTYYRHYYSKQQPWNSNGSRIMLSFDSGVGGSVYFLHGTTYAYQFTRTNVPIYPKWAHTNNDLLYGTNYSAGYLVSYVPSTGASPTIIHDFSSDGFTGGLFLGIGEGNISEDDRYVPLVGYKATTRTVIIWDLVGNAEAGRKVFTTTDMDWASMSPSGTYVIVNVNGNYEIYDTAMTLIRTSGTYGGGHADMGYDSAGNEVIVSAHYDGTLTPADVLITTTRLDTDMVTQQFRASGQGGGTWMASNYHISCRNTARHGYAYVSTFDFDFFTDAYMFREIFAVKLDGSGMAERFSQGFFAADPADSYASSAMAVPNQNGSRVMFASDWGDASAGAVKYAYICGVMV